MVELKNRERGKRCFIIGTGSSIKEQNLTLLKDEIVIGVGGLFMHNDIAIFNPKYYVLSPVFEYHKQYSDENSYVNWLSAMEQTLDKNTIYFLSDLDKPYLEKYSLFKDKKIVFKTYVPHTEEDKITDINLTKFPNIWSVSESAIQIALYLGFEEIFLLGFDHDWFNGAFVHFNGEEYLKYSSSNLKKDIIIKYGIDSELQMRRHAFIFNKYKKLYSLKQNIYNANYNKNSYVDTFPKIEYKKLFKTNYKNYIQSIKNNFIPIQSIKAIKKEDTTRILLSKQLNKIVEQLSKLDTNKKYVIYGYGVVGKIIYDILSIPNITFVDQKRDIISEKVYHPENLKNMEYDFIIISVLGREYEIESYLISKFNINKDRLIKLYIE